ncbi:MAG: hypothetical protein ACRDRP_24005 [Pseudonocardiaceae bacterium]
MRQYEHDVSSAVAQLVFEQACGERARALSLGYVDLRYQVPDRTRDGDRTDGSGWFPGVLSAAGAVAARCAGLFDPFELLGRPSRISGPAGCAALLLADAVKEIKEPLCLAWSANQLALVETGVLMPARIVWLAGRGDFSAFYPTAGVISWPDGSQIAFSISRYERKRAQQSHGHR